MNDYPPMLPLAQRRKLAEVLAEAVRDNDLEDERDGRLFAVAAHPLKDDDWLSRHESTRPGSWVVECGVHYADDDSDRTFQTVVGPMGEITYVWEVQ